MRFSFRVQRRILLAAAAATVSLLAFGPGCGGGRRDAVQPVSPQREAVQSTSPQREAVRPTSPQREAERPTSPEREVERPTSPQREAIQSGMASWYGGQFAGRRTASGEIFRPQDFTAAHRTLPFGTRVRVINVDNGRAIDVRINDRGPFTGHRIIDVSEAAARELGFHRRGLAPVRLEFCEPNGAKP